MSDRSSSGAGPALAGHSKDAATPEKAATLCGEAHALCESTRSMVREQPLLAIATAMVVGVMLGTLAAIAPRR